MTTPTNWLKGTVKCVLSGDTLVIVGVARGAPPPEKQITLSSLKAPKLGRRDGASKDEPFAWEAKEFLRKKAIGQSCIFRTDYTVEVLNNRDFGTVYLEKENLGLTVVENGWAKVNRQGSGAERCESFAELEHAEQIAKSKELGIWTKDQDTIDAAVREIPENISAAEFFAMYGKGKEVPGIVDQALNGSLLRVTLMPKFYSFLVSVAGVQAPSMSKRQPDGTTKNEPFAAQSKHFTECRVLCRDVKLNLQGLDRYDNLFAKVLWDVDGVECDLAKELLKKGFAKTVEWSLSMMTGGAQELHGLEKDAKEAKTNMWMNYVPTPSNSDKLSEKFSGEVVEVVSGDCLMVLDAASNEERRVQLSSIRAPRMGTRDRKADAWAHEAKDHLRKLLIGKTVDVQMEYNRKIPPPAGSSAKELILKFGHVTFKNVKGEDVAPSETVVENGLATIIRHRTDEERSIIYDRLIAAEDRAKAAKLNMHSGKEAPVHRVNDMTGNPKKARDYTSFLERNGKMRGMVEHVMSGHRLKILIPREGVLITFALAGVKSPSRAQPARGNLKEVKGEPYGDEAMHFTRHHLMQREVMIQVERCDMGGTYLGTLMIPGSRPFDLSLALLKKGFAGLHARFDETRPGGKELAMAQKIAQDAKIGIWENYVPPVEDPEEENGTGESSRREAGQGPMKVAVTHIEDGTRFYIQKTKDSKLRSISEQLAAMSLKEHPTPVAPAKGSMCLAKFTQDNQWYRGFVSDVKGRMADIYFMDFGNSERLEFERILPLDPSLSSIPPQAHPCQLAYLKVPDINADFGYAAAMMMDRLVGEGKECEAVTVGRDRSNAWGNQPKDPKTANPTLSLILTPIGDALSVNAQLLEAGLAKLPNLDSIRSGYLRDAIKGFVQHQDVARKYHKGLFEHGDPGDSDEEDLPPLGSKK